MKKTIIISLALLSLFLLFCKEETPVENNPWLNNFSGKIYVILDSQKVYVENVKIFLNSDSSFSNDEGYFMFEDVPNGDYIIPFLFDFSSHPFIKNRSISITSNQENKTEEYLVYQEAVFKGKVYTEIDNERINLENAKIYFLGDSTTTDIDGKFSFNYEFSIYEGRNIRFNIIYNENYFDGNETILIENPYHYNEYYLSPKISLKLEIFTIKESEKLVLNQANVRLNGEILKQDDAGRYYKNDIKYGSYKLSINYPGLYPIYDSLKLNGIENVFSYEMENILDEDIIYVQNNNYYFRNVDGNVTQITYTNDRIGDEVSFFDDGNRFVYLSVAGESHYSINMISLNPMFHRVIYESDVALTQLRISPNEDKIYFLKNTETSYYGTKFWGVATLGLSNNDFELVDYGPYNDVLLFHDCKRIAFSKRNGESDFIYHYIENFTIGDSTKIGEHHMEKGGGFFAISPNDNYILFKFSYDGIPIITLYNTVSDVFIIDNGDNDGHGMGKFTEDSEKYYGILSGFMDNDPPYLVVIIDIASGEKTVIDETDSNYIDGFNTLSYSEKSNKYLYSLNGDIKVYDVNMGSSYDFIATNDNEHAARFVKVK